MQPFTSAPDTLVIHCTASPNGKHKSVEQIRYEHMHREPVPFSDIGYHWVIDVDGKIYKGRDTKLTGAHVPGHNRHTLSVSLVGTDKFTKEQWQSLAAHVLEVQHCFPSVKSLCGHRDYSPDLNKDGKITPNEWIKMCPSFDVRRWLAAGMQPLPANIFS